VQAVLHHHFARQAVNAEPRSGVSDMAASKKKGLYANIHAKRKRIKAGSGEKMRKPGEKGAPTAKQFKKAAKTAKKKK